MYHLTDELVAAIVTKYGDALPRLNLSGNSLHTINGISRFSSVESLDLSRNQITDLGPIAAMTQLRELNLAENSMYVLHQRRRLFLLCSV
jgi:Leucine-rich repeat (LRR) protein